MNKSHKLAYFLVFLCSFAVIDMAAMQFSDAADVKKMQERLDGIADTDRRDYINKNNLLHWEAAAGRAGSAKFLIKSGASVESQNKEGRTALQEAARKAELGVIKVLIESGAMFGENSLQSVIEGFHDCMLILSTEAELKDTDLKKKEYITVGQYLIDQGARLSEQRNVKGKEKVTGEIQALTASLEQGLIKYQEEFLKRQAIRQRVHDTALTVAQALHPRLGAASPLAFIGQQLVYDISRMAGDYIKSDPSWQVDKETHNWWQRMVMKFKKKAVHS